jgi:TgpA N-terminal domain/Transglutaminase-like superfamily
LSDLAARWSRSGAAVLPAVAREVALPLAVATASFLAVFPCLRAYQVPGAGPFVAAAAILSTVITFTTVRYGRQGPAVSYPVSVAGLVVVLFAGAGLHPAQIFHAIGDGPNRLLTETLPLTGPRSSLSALIVLTWLCAAATSELVGRGWAGRRGLAVGVAVPLACYVLCYSVSASAPGRDRVAGPLLFLVLAGMVLTRQHETHSAARFVGPPAPGESDGRPPRYRRIVVGAAVAIAVTALVAAVVPALPGMSHRPASLHHAAPTVAGVVVDPVDAMAALRDSPPKAAPYDVLQVDLNSPSTGYLAVAVLDSYDGALWHFDATFEPTGGRIPGAPGAGRSLTATPVTQRVDIERALPVELLPALDRPVTVSGLPVAADAGTGMILPDEETSGRFEYSVTSLAPTASLASVSPADGIGNGPSSVGSVLPGSDTSLPPGTSAAMGTTMKFLATLTGQRPVATVGFLQALLTALHSKERRIDPHLTAATQAPAPNAGGRPGARPRASTPTSPSTTAVSAVTASTGGTSLSEVVNAITVVRSATPEQFATLFAMAARYLGIPARIVTGFRINPTSAGGRVAAGSYQVTNRQAWAWVEIPVAGIGWVVADPTPDTATAVAAPPAQTESPPTTLPPRQANAVPRSQISGGHPLAKPSTVAIAHPYQVPVWLLGLLIFAAVVLLVLAAGPGLAAARRRWRRRSRRASPDPAALAVGAWLELLDGLSQAGMRTAAGSTSSEVAGEAGGCFGPDVVDSVQQVGSLADRALCSTREPPDHASAEGAWTTQRDLVHRIHAHLDRRARARALMSVGSSPRWPSGPDEGE